MNIIKKIFNKIEKYKPIKKITDIILNSCDQPIIKIENKEKKVITNQKIPTVVYKSWINNSFWIRHYRHMNYFRNLNPDLDFKIYAHIDSDNYMKEVWNETEIYKKSLFGPMKADIFRYCILFDKGGYYFDINKGCNIQITTLHDPNTTALISFGQNECILPPDFEIISKLNYSDKYYLQWGFGFIKNHPILENMINNICNYYPYFKNKIFINPKSAILAFTGPGMFTKSVRESMHNINSNEITQAGIDFNGNGIFNLHGSEVRYNL
jgi:mannosyltransferase OCH1-like enzyme